MSPTREFPGRSGTAAAASWTGTGFLVDGRLEPVLVYGAEGSGWNDDLNLLHAETSQGQHFIDVASRRSAIDQLMRHLDQNGRPEILEIGCSGGHFLRDLLAAMPAAALIGADYTVTNLYALRADFPGIPLLQFDVTRCPLPSESIDAVVILNILEHIDDDELAMRQIYRILKPGGIVIIEVPAGPELFDSYDAFLQHRRRYSMKRLLKLSADAGFTPLEKSHLGALLYPAFWVTKMIRKVSQRFGRGHARDIVVQSISVTQGANPIGTALMRFEAVLRSRIYLPFGIRCLLTAQKTPSAL